MAVDLSIFGNTFFNLSLAGGVTHLIDSGVGNGITVNGLFDTNTVTSSNRAILRSSVNGVQAELNLQGTQAICDIDVKDSNAIGQTAIALGSLDSGNNTNWSFQATIGTIMLGGSVSRTGAMRIGRGWEF